MWPYLKSSIEELVDSDSIQVVFWMAGAGVAVTAGNLLFAAVLPAEDFGRLTLLLALLSLGVGVAPLGFNQLAVRRELPPEWKSVGQVAAVATVPASALAVGGIVVYGLSPTIGALLLLAGLAGGVGLICSSYDRAVVRLNAAQFVVQIPYLIYAAGACVFYLLEVRSWSGGAICLVAGYVVSAAAGLGSFSRNRTDYLQWKPQQYLTGRDRWVRALVFVGVAMSGLLLVQVERLIIPRVLGLAELATFNVVFSIAGSPYKLLHGGIGYALMPRLRESESPGERKTLVWRELRRALVLCGLMAVAVLLLAVPAVRFLYGAKYAVSYSLVGAIVLAGTARVMQGITGAIVAALGSDLQLKRYQIGAWGATLVAFLLAVLFGAHGLVAVVLAAGAGWLTRCIVAWGAARGAFPLRADPGSDTSVYSLPDEVGPA